jgi:hypothetical protein
MGDMLIVVVVRLGAAPRPGNLYRDVMSATDRDHLASNIVGHLSDGVEWRLQERASHCGGRWTRTWARGSVNSRRNRRQVVTRGRKHQSWRRRSGGSLIPRTTLVLVSPLIPPRSLSDSTAHGRPLFAPVSHPRCDRANPRRICAHDAGPPWRASARARCVTADMRSVHLYAVGPPIVVRYFAIAGWVRGEPLHASRMSVRSQEGQLT